MNSERGTMKANRMLAPRKLGRLF